MNAHMNVDLTLYAQALSLVTFSQGKTVGATGLLFELEGTTCKDVMLGGRLAFLFILHRAILELIDHHHTVAIVADPVLIHVVLDHTVKAGVFGAHKKNGAVARQHVNAGRQIFFVSFTFFGRHGEIVFFLRHHGHVAHAEVTFFFTLPCRGSGPPLVARSG